MATDLHSLTGNHGTEDWPGKTLALIGDSRIDGGRDQTKAMQTLLSVVGEDPVNVNPKGKPHRKERLQARVVFAANEVPHLRDVSGAFTARTVLLRMTQQFRDTPQENVNLKQELLAERTGILNWALAGWKRLRDRGHFVQPASGLDLKRTMREAASHVQVFLNERCSVGPKLKVVCDDLYQAWRRWSDDAGRQSPGNSLQFGIDLRAALPTVERKRIGPKLGKRPWYYVGVTARAGV